MTNHDLKPAFSRDNVPVVIASSNTYAPYAGVFIRSLLDHASAENNYDIIVFEREISDENKRLLKSFETANLSIRFYKPSLLFQEYTIKENQSYPLEPYYKIIAPHVMGNFGRIIVVDIDTLLMADIAGLMEVNLDGRSVGGVWDIPAYGYRVKNHWFSTEGVSAEDVFQKVCSLEDMLYYINTGLLVFDCEKYVQELSVKTILTTAQQKQFSTADQDTLNYLMLKKIKPMDCAWNVLLPVSQHMKEGLELGDKAFGGAWTRSMEHPYMLHWANRPKPWVCPDVPYGSEWWQTALRTPFIGHIIVRMLDEQAKRRAYYKKRYGKEDVDVWDPTPKGIDRG